MAVVIDYPEDVKMIAHYLLDKDIVMSKEEIQKKYRAFSDTYAAGWMDVDNNLLEEFYLWLEDEERRKDIDR